MTSHRFEPDAMKLNRNVPLRGIADTTRQVSAPADSSGAWALVVL